MNAVFRMCFWGFLVFNFLTCSTVVGQPFGLTNRVANTTLRMPTSLPVFGYSFTNALGNLTFTAPVAIVTAPGDSNRLFIVEQIGRIVVITNLANPTRTVFMDVTSRVNFNGEQGLLGLVFHPGYLTNRFFFVFYVTPGTRMDRLSRFEISPTNPNQGLTNTEVILISQADDFANHNAGDLHFGADGYLYVSLGDEGDANDTGANSQRIDKDFFASIIRIDVDKRPESLAPTPHPASSTNYAIPPDNPFIGATTFNGLPLTGNVRTEIWAIGLRNPWRWSFDPPTGLLYCADVGQGAREEVDIIVKGGNYGWNYREGKIARPGSSAPPPGFSAIDPILDYPHTPNSTTNGNSITGGVVYHGSRFPELDGAYIFGDYGSTTPGNFWALRYDGTNVTAWSQLFTDPGVAAFGIDPSNGDVLYADVNEGRIKRLVRVVTAGAPVPPTLADTGAFTNLTTLTPHAGVVAYDVTVPQWADNAIMTRWFCITNPSARFTFRATNFWTLPSATVWIQHFDLELTNGVPGSRRRLETRFLVRDATATGAYGVTYRWSNPPTNAVLVDEAGMDENFTIQDGGMVRTQTWHYPGRSECLVCHNPNGNRTLGFNTPQLNRDFLYPNGVVDNQIRSLSNANYFVISSPVSNLHSLPLLTPLTNEAFSAEYRVRSYLMANCYGCHPGGGVSGLFDTRIYRPLSTLRIIDGALNNNLGDTNNRVVKPGSLANSMLLTRLSSSNPALHMPPDGTTFLDTQAIALVSYWITNKLASYQSFAAWQIQYFGATNAPEAASAADPDMDRGLNFQEYLTGTNPTTTLDAWGIGIERTGDIAEIVFPRIANRGFETQWTTTLSNNAVWQFLDLPQNRPFFSATNTETRIPDPVTNAPAKFYRVRVYEP